MGGQSLSLGRPARTQGIPNRQALTHTEKRGVTMVTRTPLFSSVIRHL